ncbi:cell wall elongation regulator TseB-like domain-containing protein [Salirhabdus salicampi]|uniref:cell wall elongation regulator TseB-like domain-containing protein n=1 Tax=Salirhabdus salicampi TaxID=476102 RepID=UPI0020C2DB46|nr:DUF5590 domain-containing protein [Salirhabdus salicampi]MCP8616670.1 DUF5590 domain-containing protein [Salirhabdus salicampi]
MKRQQYSRSIKQSRKRLWFIAVVFLSLVAVGYVTLIYLTAVKGKQATFSHSEQRALDSTPLASVTNTDRFNGAQPFDIVVGETNEGELGYAFVPIDSEDEDIRYVPADSGLSNEDIIAIWSSQCRSCTLIDLQLGIDEDVLLWELIYYDENQRYTFDYYTFRNGNVYEQFKLKTK